MARCLSDSLRAFLAADLSKPVVFMDLGTLGDAWASPAARQTLLLQCLEAFTLAKVLQATSEAITSLFLPLLSSYSTSY